MAGRVLIAERDATHRTALQSELSAACYDVSTVADPEALLEFLDSGAPDVLMIGVEMLSDEVLEDLRRSRDGQDTTIVGLLQTGQDRAGALMSGLDEALARPVGGAFLQARLRSLIRSTHQMRELRRNQITASDYGFAEASTLWRPAPIAALVSQDAAQIAAWKTGLGNVASCIFSPKEILTLEEQSGPAPDSIVIELGGDTARSAGLTLLAELRNRQATRRIPILAVLTGPPGDGAAMALDLGADDVLPAPADADELRLRVDRLLTRKEELDALRSPVEESLRLAAIDPLTGLFNRRYAMNAMRGMVHSASANPTSETVTVMIADLDQYKLVNDRFGHDAGDAVLVEVARRLRDGLRPDDLLARIGGDEFLIVMHGLSASESHSAAERLCRRIRGLKATDGGTGIGQSVTVSIGVALGHITADSSNPDALRAAADAALYAAKAAGRDSVCVARIDASVVDGMGGKSAA